jgi:hypothetical protein
VQEELLPEAFGQVDVVILVLRAAASVVCPMVWPADSTRQLTLNSVSYSWMILGWNTSGRDTCVSGDGSMALLCVLCVLEVESWMLKPQTRAVPGLDTPIHAPTTPTTTYRL